MVKAIFLYPHFQENRCSEKKCEHHFPRNAQSAAWRVGGKIY